MPDLEPTPPPAPSSDPPPRPSEEEAKLSLPPALTGLAGMVVGSILLGKKAGLLAGLVGLGAKLLLESRSPAETAPELVIPPAEPAAEPAVDTGKAEFPALASMSESLSVAAAMDIPEAPEPAPKLGLGVDCAAFPALALMNLGLGGSETATPPAILEAAPPEPTAMSPEPLSAIVPESIFVAPDEPAVALEPLTVAEWVRPAWLRGAEPSPLLIEPPAPAKAPPFPPAIATPGPMNLPLDDALDDLIDHAEAFRNLGASAHFPLAAELPPLIPAAPPAPGPECPEEKRPAFVVWPEALEETEETSAQSNFQAFVANMFQQAAETHAPPPPAPEAAPPPLATAVELTADDIWRMALAANLAESQAAKPPHTPSVVGSAAPEILRVEESMFVPSASPPPSPPAGLAPFVELVASQPFKPAEALFAQALDPDLFTPSSAAPRAPLLTPEEEATLDQLADSGKRPAVVLPSAPSAATPLLMSPPVSYAMRTTPGIVKRATPWIALAALMAGGYTFRDPLGQQWQRWRAPLTQPAAPARTKPPLPATVPSEHPSPPTTEVPPAPTVRPAMEVPAAPNPLEPTPQPITPETTAPTDPELAAQREAETAIKSFLGYSDLEDVLSHILHRDQLTPAVAKYYLAQPLAPTPFTEVVIDSAARLSETNLQAFLFRVRTADRPLGFPICAEATPAGYKIQWESFIQCRDRTAANFWKSPQSDPQSLYVILKRSHYFGEDVGHLEEYDCYRINTPNPDEEAVYAFARKDAAFSRKYRNQLAWDANYFAVALFANIRNAEGIVHHEILDIDRFNWRCVSK